MSGLFKKHPPSETKTQIILYFPDEVPIKTYGKTPEQAMVGAVRELGFHGIIHEFTRKPWCNPRGLVRQVPANYKER